MEKFQNKIKEFIEISKNLKQKTEEQEQAMRQMARFFEVEGMEFRNTNCFFLAKIYEKYPEEKVLNCYGDIFYILERSGSGHNTVYIGQRILWNLELSKEKYCIQEEYEFDDDGSVAMIWYDKDVMLNDYDGANYGRD